MATNALHSQIIQTIFSTPQESSDDTQIIKKITSNALHSQIIQIIFSIPQMSSKNIQIRSLTLYSQKNLSKFKPLKLCAIGV